MEEEDVIAALVFLDGAALCLYFQAATWSSLTLEITEILNLGIIDLHLLSDHMAVVRRLQDQGLFTRKLVDIICSKYIG